MLWKAGGICNNSSYCLLIVLCQILSLPALSYLVLTETYEVGTIINLILEKREMKYREVR